MRFQKFQRPYHQDTLKIALFDLTNRIKIVTVYEKYVINRKEPGAAIGIFGSGSGSRRQFNFGSSAPAPQHRQKEYCERVSGSNYIKNC
jgi:hypothetical protein